MIKPIRTESENNPFEGTVVTVPNPVRRGHLFGIEKKEKQEEKRMAKIKLNQDMTICLDGIRPSEFKAGDVVEFPIHIAATLLEDGRASVNVIEEKAIPGASENKMEKGPSLNKKKR